MYGSCLAAACRTACSADPETFIQQAKGVCRSFIERLKKAGM